MTGYRKLRELAAAPSHIIAHVAIIIVSAAIALSLPYTLGVIAQKFLVYWAFIGNEELFMVTVEILTAVGLILLFNYVRWVWRERKRSAMARAAGFVSFRAVRGPFSRLWNRRQKEHQAAARDVMVLGSTGCRTFAGPDGDLHEVLRNCREARIMLLNPDGDGAVTRARSISDPDITADTLRQQVAESIRFLKSLQGMKQVRLKLYDHAPFLKLAISGDYLWVRHYHAGMDVQAMPEYVFVHSRDGGGLYGIFYQHFLNEWNDHRIPEYDLETDELVYRDADGGAVRRVRPRLLDDAGDFAGVPSLAGSMRA